MYLLLIHVGQLDYSAEPLIPFLDSEFGAMVKSHHKK